MERQARQRVISTARFKLFGDSMIEPWSKFFWSDYEADEGLRICSLAAQGLWMRMLCTMARATPKGELRIGGEPCSNQDLAKLVSESDVTVDALLSELKRRGVFSVTRVGVIFSRRMRKDAEISRKRAEAGKIGGNASLGKNKQTQICSSKTQANGEAKLKPQKPEARVQKEKKEGFANLIDPPPWLPQEPWNRFVQSRKAARKPVTAHAAQLLIAKLDRFRAAGQSPSDILDQSTENGWTSIYEIKKPQFSSENRQSNQSMADFIMAKSERESASIEPT